MSLPNSCLRITLLPTFWKPSWGFWLGECLHSAFNIYSYLIPCFWISPVLSVVPDILSSKNLLLFPDIKTLIKTYAGMKRQLLNNVELDKGSRTLPAFQFFSVFFCTPILLSSVSEVPNTATSCAF